MALIGSYTFKVVADTLAEYQAFLTWVEWYVSTPNGIIAAVTLSHSQPQRRITISCPHAPVVIPLGVPQ